MIKTVDWRATRTGSSRSGERAVVVSSDLSDWDYTS